MNTNDKKQKFYTQKWCMWLSLILFAPIGIFLMWKFQPGIDKKVKIILTIIFLMIFLYAIGTSNVDNQINENNQSTTETNKNNDQKKQEKLKKKQQKEKEKQQKEEEKLKKQEEKEQQKLKKQKEKEQKNKANEKKTKTKKNDIVFVWKSTCDIKHEGIEETKILEVGKNLETGKYQLQYSYNEYKNKQTNNKYNRMYFIYIATKKISDISGENINKLEKYIIKSYMFYPDDTSDKNITINLKKGQYVYIQHTAKKEAGDGTIKIKKL